MSTPVLPRILCVDDEPHILDGLRRNLRRNFDVHVAVGGAAGLDTLATHGPFAAVISDMRMPGMSGAEFLKEVCGRCPDTTRMLLTGHAEVDAAIAAVNEGHIYRFLTKPCPPEVLVPAIEGAVELNRLRLAERELLEQTLHGSIRVLTNLLAMAQPTAFGRAVRVKKNAARLAEALELASRWPVEIAAMLSQIGWIALPPEVAERAAKGAALDDAEQAMVDRMPAAVEELLGPIPRLEAVREALAWQHAHYDGSGVRPDARPGDGIPLGGRILKLALDCDAFESRGCAGAELVRQLRAHAGRYDPKLLDLFIPGVGAGERTLAVTLDELRQGMILAADVQTSNGMLLVARGQEVSASLLERIRNFAAKLGVKEPLQVRGA